jgi:hypothetical protein
MVSFPEFIVSLAATAAVHLGDRAKPGGEAPGEPDLPSASQIIDLLALIEEKTRGNLSAEERTLLEQVLYDLRLRFLEAQASGKRIIEP